MISETLITITPGKKACFVDNLHRPPKYKMAILSHSMATFASWHELKRSLFLVNQKCGKMTNLRVVISDHVS